MLIICFVFLLRRKLTLIHCCLLSSVLQQEMVYQLRASPPFSLPPPTLELLWDMVESKLMTIFLIKKLLDFSFVFLV